MSTYKTKKGLFAPRSPVYLSNRLNYSCSARISFQTCQRENSFTRSFALACKCFSKASSKCHLFEAARKCFQETELAKHARKSCKATNFHFCFYDAFTAVLFFSTSFIFYLTLFCLSEYFSSAPNNKQQHVSI